MNEVINNQDLNPSLPGAADHSNHNSLCARVTALAMRALVAFANLATWIVTRVATFAAAGRRYFQLSRNLSNQPLPASPDLSQNLQLSLSTVSQNDPDKWIPRLNRDVSIHILSFLGPKELGRSEEVCKSWRGFITKFGWERPCKILLNLPAEIDPARHLPVPSSYKESLRLIFSRVFGEGYYEHYLGAKVGSVPPIPIRRWNERDPCEPAKTVGENYVLMYFPSYITITVPADSPWCLDKKDNPDDPVAPRLIQRASLVGRITRIFGLGANQESKVLQVPVTINNVETLFKHHLKAGYPAQYDDVSNAIIWQHGNERISAGYTWMRRDVIGRDLTFAQQQALANEKGIEIPNLLQRILFNFLGHVRTNTYPDGQDPWIYARTSTLTQGSWVHMPSGCGAGGPRGLGVSHYDIIHPRGVGVAVALPAEVQAIGP
jgi:hypothetical protein